MALVLVGKFRMVSLKNRGAFGTIVRINIVVFPRWIIVHVVDPSVPGWRDLLDLCREKFSSVSVFDPTALVLAKMGEVFVVPVAKFIDSN